MHKLTGARKVPSALSEFGFATCGFEFFLRAFGLLERVFFDFPVFVCVWVGGT